MPGIQGGNNANQIRQTQAPATPPQGVSNAQKPAPTQAPQNAASPPTPPKDQNQTQSVNNTPINPNTAGNTMGRAQFTQQILNLANQPPDDMHSFDVQTALQQYITDHAGGPEKAERFANVFSGQNGEAYTALVNDGLNSIRNLPEGQREEALNRFVNLMLNNIDNVASNNPVRDEKGQQMVAGGPGC